MDLMMDIIDARGITENECVFVLDIHSYPDKLYSLLMKIKPITLLKSALIKYGITKASKMKQILEKMIRFEKSIECRVLWNMVSEECSLKQYI